MSTTTGRRAARVTGTSALLLATLMVLAALMAVWFSANRTPTSPSAATTSVPSTSQPASPSTSTELIEATPPGALTFQALLTPDDLTAIGLSGTTVGARDAPQFPVSCRSSTWTGTWSDPAQNVGHDYQGTGAGITEHAFGYASAADAGSALDRLVTDSATCADQAGQAATTSTDAGLGDASAVFRFDDGGRDGVLAVTWAVVTRSADTLLLITYTTQTSIGTGSGPADGGDDATGDSPQATSTALALAQAALDRLADS